MRNKLVSAFLCMLMFSGLVLPLMVTNTSDMLELAKPLNRIELSEASYIWHHDCSNTTDFVSQDTWDTSWYSAGWTLDNGLLSSSGTNLSISSIPSGSGWHGPAFTYEFGTTFNVSEVLDFTVDLQIDNAAANYLGRYYLYLADTNQLPTYLFTYHDYLAASTTGAYGVQYFFENGTYFAHGSPSPYSYTGFDGRMETGLDGMNVYGYVDGFGAENITILDESELSREIKYIVFMGGAFGADPLMPSWLHDISLTTSVPIQMAMPRQLASWHHDCSNTTGFVYNDTWNMNWMPWDIQTGTLASDGSMLSVTNVVTGSGWHGPVFEYELPGTFRVRDIENLTAVFNVDNSLNSYLGYEVLMFGGSDRNPVIFCSFHDGWADYRQGSYGVAYVFPNGSYVGFGSGYPVTWTSFSGKMNASYTEAGLLAYVDGHGEGILPGLSETDFNREIKYVAIASARFGSDPLIPVRIDEIFLNHMPVYEPLQPTIDDVENFGYEAGSTENVIVWTIANFTPTFYMLYRDGGLISSDIWPGGIQIEINIDNLALGVYNYTIVVSGEGDIIVSDTVMVNVVDTTPPFLNHPSDVLTDLETSSIQITWQPTDLFPLNYIILKNGTLVSSGLWTSGENLAYTIDEMIVGSHNITIIVWDTSGNYNTDTVFILIESEPTLDYFMLSISVGGLVIIVVVVGLICRNRKSAPI